MKFLASHQDKEVNREAVWIVAGPQSQEHYGLCKDYSVILFALPALTVCKIYFLLGQESQHVSQGNETWCGLWVSLCSWIVIFVINSCHLLRITLQTYNSADMQPLEIKVSSCWVHFDEIQPNCFQEQGPVSGDTLPIPLRILSKILAKGAAVIWVFRKYWQSSTAKADRQHESLGCRGDSTGLRKCQPSSGLRGWWKLAASPVIFKHLERNHADCVS